MLPKKNRLPSHIILQTLKKGQRFYSSLFILIVHSQQPAVKNIEPKFAFIVSAKVNKRAVVRNRLKRQLREAVWKNLNKIKGNNRVVIMVKKGLMPNFCSSIKGEIEKLLKQADLIKKTH